MGRGKKSFDLFTKLYRLRNTVFKMTRFPILSRIGKKIIEPESITLTYIPINENIILPESSVAPISIIEQFIKEASHHVILKRCPCRSENNCKSYDPYFGCTFLGEAAKEIDPEVGRHVSAAEALAHLREATKTGLVSVVGSFKGDALMLGVKNHQKLMTICHCCPCCCISGSIIHASRESRDLIARLEGLNVRVNELCNGCGICVDACIFKQATIVNGKAQIGAECKGCGRCATACKRSAIDISIEDPAWMQKCIERIKSRVDVS